MILVSKNGLMCACSLVKDNPKSWVINYNDKAFPGNKRVPKDGNRALFKTVDEAFEWLGE
jgi:hypothetical protein